MNPTDSTLPFRNGTASDILHGRRVNKRQLLTTWKNRVELVSAVDDSSSLVVITFGRTNVCDERVIVIL